MLRGVDVSRSDIVYSEGTVDMHGWENKKGCSGLLQTLCAVFSGVSAINQNVNM